MLNVSLYHVICGCFQKFQEEDKQLSSTEAYMRRSDSLKRVSTKYFPPLGVSFMSTCEEPSYKYKGS